MALFLVIGAGYTGGRVARRLLARGERVLALAREAEGMAAVARRGAQVAAMDLSGTSAPLELARLTATEEELRLLYALPPLAAGSGREDAMARLLRALGQRLSRLVYLSSTRVYGRASIVDARTPAAPEDEVGRRRLEAERLAADGPWRTLVLRSAAIYGPWRGLHVALRRGELGRVRDLDRVVSRVYVDDLAALAEAALLCEAVGAQPVADELPAPAREVAAYCEGLGLPGLPASASCEATPGEARGRRVDGAAARLLLGLTSIHPSYRTGIPAALAEEGASIE